MGKISCVEALELGLFALAARADLRELFVFEDPDLGEPASGYFRIPRSAAALRARGDL